MESTAEGEGAVLQEGRGKWTKIKVKGTLGDEASKNN